jgi:hypothetical protein
MLNKET